MQSDSDIEQLVREGRHLAAFKLLQERRRAAQRGHPQRAPFDELLHDLWQLKRSGVPFGMVLALFFGTLLVVVLLILGLTFVGVRVSEWTLFPAMDRLLAVLWPVMFSPGVLPAMALAVLVCGIVFERKFRSPILFLTGITGIALGLVCFWLFPFYISLLQQRAPAEAEVPLLIVGGVISLLLFVCGVQLIAQANK
jgi:hypothetical protein